MDDSDMKVKEIKLEVGDAKSATCGSYTYYWWTGEEAKGGRRTNWRMTIPDHCVISGGVQVTNRSSLTMTQSCPYDPPIRWIVGVENSGRDDEKVAVYVVAAEQ